MMLKVKLQIGRKTYGSGCKRSIVGKFDVSNTDERERETTRGKFVNKVCVTMKETWCSDGTVEEKWDVMKSALCEAAGSVLGSASKRQADWFRENEALLRPLFEERSRLYALWLSTGSERDKRKFAGARRAARRAVRMAKNGWFQMKLWKQKEGRMVEKWFGDASGTYNVGGGG